MEPDEAAWRKLDRFVTRNAEGLRLVAGWEDGNMGAIMRLFRDRLGIPDPPPRPKSAEGAKRKAAEKSRRASVLARDECRCLKCGATNDLTIDHIVPRAFGGASRISNLQTLCRPCNSAKGATIADYRKVKS